MRRRPKENVYEVYTGKNHLRLETLNRQEALTAAKSHQHVGLDVRVLENGKTIFLSRSSARADKCC